MVAQLVLATVFKTVEPYVKHAVGGFDSHALPPFSQLPAAIIVLLAAADFAYSRIVH